MANQLPGYNKRESRAIKPFFFFLSVAACSADWDAKGSEIYLFNKKKKKFFKNQIA